MSGHAGDGAVGAAGAPRPPRPSVLFVDDEPHILAGLRRALSPLRGEWEMVFVDSGAAATALLETRGVDIVVSDMLMPGMDGVTLLRRVRDLRPEAARVVLSGHADMAQIAQVTAVAHRYLHKPCDVETLRLLLDELLRESARTTIGLRRLIGRIDRLPAQPQVHRELMDELRGGDPSIARAAHIVQGDVAISAKFLQLVNSAFFGIGQRVTKVEQAVALLGIDIVSALALTMGLFHVGDEGDEHGVLRPVWTHSLAVAARARLLAEHVPVRLSAETAFTAGLLHDIGLIAIAASLPRELTALMRPDGEPWDEEAEVARFEATHADLGAYLLRLWGIPEALAQVAEGHWHPHRVVEPVDPALLAVVHAADAWERPTRSGDATSPRPEVAADFLATHLGSGWQQRAAVAWGDLPRGASPAA